MMLQVVSRQMGRSSRLDTEERSQHGAWKGARERAGEGKEEWVVAWEEAWDHAAPTISVIDGPQPSASLYHWGSGERNSLWPHQDAVHWKGQNSHFSQAPRQCACTVKSEMLWPSRSVSRRRVCCLRGSRERGLLK